VKVRLRAHAQFSADRMAKITLGATARVHLDLYALEPGQLQKVHTHDDQDKVYVVLEGRGRFTVGAVEEVLEVGEAIVAAAGAPHGVVNDSGAPLLLLVVAPPPRPAAGRAPPRRDQATPGPTRSRGSRAVRRIDGDLPG